MKLNNKKTFLGSILAFILGTSCCWLTSLAFWLGGAGIFTLIGSFTSQYQKYILSIATILLLMAIYQFIKHKMLNKE